jgi:DNA-binding NtrC family response regulator
MSADLTPVPNVLVVEDEMILRMRAVDIVEDAGFRSVEAVNADEAISILESRSDISLLYPDARQHRRPETRPRGATNADPRSRSHWFLVR